MIAFPNAKINLGLRVIEKRGDGYHNIETVFYPIPFYDVLEFIESDHFTFQSTGLQCGDIESNLCVKAYQVLKENFPDIPEIILHLLKMIPTGAGLGGGSADGACVLQFLNKEFSLGLEKDHIRKLALQLGSDSPFFILNKPCLAYGRGEDLKEIDLSLKGYYLLLVTPDIHISTKEIFNSFHIRPSTKSVGEAIQLPLSEWKNHLNNDFEPIVFKMYPELKIIKNALYDRDAIYASMSGTGSSVYGLFRKRVLFPVDFLYNFQWLEL